MNRTRIVLCTLVGTVAIATATTGTVLVLDADPAAAAEVDARPATVSVRGAGISTANPDVLRVS